MKKHQLVNFVNLMMLAITTVAMSQCQKPNDNAELQSLYYPTATKYAIILSATKAELEGNKVLPLVAHCRINGDAKLK